MVDSDGLMIEVDGGKSLEAGPRKTERKPAAAAEEVDEGERIFHELNGFQKRFEETKKADSWEAERFCQRWQATAA